MRVKLEDVCERGSSNLKQSDIVESKNGYSIYGASGLIGNVDFYHQEKPYVAVVKDGAGIGRTMFLPEKSSIIGTMQYLLPKQNILPRYLYYVVRYMHLEKYFSGATIPHIYFRDYKNEEFNLDSFDKQEKIVQTLDAVESITSARQQELQKLDDLVKDRFVEMFGDLYTNPFAWKIKSFSEFAQFDCNMTTDYDKYAEYPHIGIDCIEKDTGKILDYKTVKEDGVISGKYLFSSKHIIYSKIRPYLNKVALPNFDGVCSADAYPILPVDGVTNRIYLANILRSKHYLEFVSHLSTRANMPKVNKTEISGYSAPIAPIELQDVFADFVKQVDKSKVAIQKELNLYTELFNTKMHEYFDGEVS